MSIGPRLKSLLKKIDLFSTPISFTYDDNLSYQSATGGFCTLATIITFIIIFMSTLQATVNRTTINFTQFQSLQYEPTSLTLNNSNFYFAVGLNDIDLTKGPRY